MSQSTIMSIGVLTGIGGYLGEETLSKEFFYIHSVKRPPEPDWVKKGKE